MRAHFSEPMFRHAIVAMVERANRISANPYRRLGLAFEESIIYRDNVRHHLSRLGEPERKAVMLMAEGHTIAFAASTTGLSIRSLQRSLDQAWVN